MSNFLHRLLHREGRRRAPGVMDRTYVSEYTRFMDQFIHGHPDVLEDQRKGWLIYWEKRVDLAAQKKAETDTVPSDGYGFYYSAWASKNHPPSPDKGNKKFPRGTMNVFANLHSVKSFPAIQLFSLNGWRMSNILQFLHLANPTGLAFCIPGIAIQTIRRSSSIPTFMEKTPCFPNTVT